MRLTVTTRGVPSRAFASPLIIAYIFAGLITVGTCLLILPFTQHDDGFTPFMTAFFTATSAITVTGLVIEDTATYWSRTGQVVILALMFVGGLGFMTLATFLLILLGQRVTLTQRLLVRESLGVNQLGGLIRLTVGIVLLAVAIQAAGFVALFIRFSSVMPTAEAAWQGAFHAVSGFNNAGFTALADSPSVSAYQGDEAVIGILSVLIFLGAISYWVIVDVVRTRRFSLFTLSTKLVLVTTFALIALGAAVFYASEHGNVRTLGHLPVAERVMVSVFESLSGRTAGFSTVSFAETASHTNFFFISLMFIGGASASVAGGIKVNTFAIVVAAILSTLRGRSHASVFGREIPQSLVQRAMVIGAVATVFVFVVALLLTYTEAPFQFIDLLFESVSAFGTVGLSTGLTADLSGWGHFILIVTMFIGRLGPLTLGLAMLQQPERDTFRYAQERVTIG